MSLLQTVVIEIGLISLKVPGVGIFGIGITVSIFQILGQISLANETLNIRVRGIASGFTNGLMRC